MAKTIPLGTANGAWKRASKRQPASGVASSVFPSRLSRLRRPHREPGGWPTLPATTWWRAASRTTRSGLPLLRAIPWTTGACLGSSCLNEVATPFYGSGALNWGAALSVHNWPVWTPCPQATRPVACATIPIGLGLQGRLGGRLPEQRTAGAL